jgi:hypothetical protein
MSASIDSTLTIPATDQVFKLGDTESLRNALIIGAPSTPENTPPSLTFERKRDVEIPWRDIFSGVETGIDESVEAIRLDLEQSVGKGGKTLEFMDDADVAALAPYYAVLGAPGPDPQVTDAPAPLKAYRPKFANPTPAEPPPAEPPPDIVVTPEEIPAGVIFRHGSGRVYLLLPVEGETLSLDDFANAAVYADAWNRKIAGTELVYLDSAEVGAGASEFEEIDLAARVIESKFKELLELRNYQKTLDEKAAEVIDQMLTNAVTNNLDLDEVERIQNKGLSIKMALHRIQMRIRRLTNQASDLGYVLFDEDQPAPAHPDNKGQPLEAGVLYEKYRRVAKWTTVNTVNRVIQQTLRILFVKVKTRRVVKQLVQQQHSRIVEDYRKVDTSRDLLADKVEALRAAGFQVSVFRSTPQGYLSDENVRLDEVMAECGRNEQVRRACAVILPIFEQSMSGQRALIKYHLFKRPLPGVQPTAMPRLTLIESLSYRLAWTGAQVSEVVSSLNLAPGESRTITMRREYETETTITEKRSSVFDLDRQESNDLSSEMEDQMRAESEHSDETSMSLSVSASYGFVSGSANASHGSKNSLKNFSQALNKVAKKSSQAVNSKQRQEVSTSSTSRTKVSTLDETTAKIENINQGRTLNLMFYRLYNRFESGLFVEGLRFQVLSSVEIIAGSGIQRSSTYGFDSFADMINEFGSCALPIRVATADKYRYLTNVLSEIDGLIRAEYRRAEKKKEGAGLAFARSVGILTLPVGGAATNADSRKYMDMVAQEQDLEECEEYMRKLEEKKQQEADRIAALKEQLETANKHYAEYLAKLNQVAGSLKRATLDSSAAIEGTQQELLVAAPGLYLDSNLGVQPATELFSEAMREQRVRQEAADVALKAAEAEYKLALAARLRRNVGAGNSGESNWITGIIADTSTNTVRLKLKHPVDAGNWQLFVDGEAVAAKQVNQIGDSILAIELANTEPWLGRDDLMTSALELRNDAAGQVLTAFI